MYRICVFVCKVTDNSGSFCWNTAMGRRRCDGSSYLSIYLQFAFVRAVTSETGGMMDGVRREESLRAGVS